MKSMLQRQFSLIAGLILLSFLLLGVSLVPLTYQYTMLERQESMEANADFIARLTASLWVQGGQVQDSGFRIQISFAAMMANSTIFICRNDGLVLLSTDGSLNSFDGEYMPQEVCTELLEKGRFAARSNLGGLFSELHHVVGMPVESLFESDVVWGYVFIAAKTENLTAIWRSVAVIGFWCMMGSLVIAFVSTFFITARQIRPLREMAGAARRFGRGQFDVRVSDYCRRDEVGELARAFNNMAQSLEQSELRRRDFIANISHELKTPLTTISGFTDGILDGTIPPARVEESLRTVSAESHRLARLVRRMLEISRLQDQVQAMPQGAFDIAETVRRVLLSLENKINERGLDVEAEIPEDPVLVFGDKDSILQVCYNLLENAIKFSPEGDTLGISIIKKTRKIYISVRNRAPDISPEELSRIFERFHKTDRSRGLDRDGVGLGLYIVKTILDTHQEDITVTSEDGLTTFMFTLTPAD